MKKSLATIFFCVVSLFFSQGLLAQKDSLKNKNIVLNKDSMNKSNDSLNASMLQNYALKLGMIEKQRIDDSIKKAELETRISSLKTTDNLKKGNSLG